MKQSVRMKQSHVTRMKQSHVTRMKQSHVTRMKQSHVTRMKQSHVTRMKQSVHTCESRVVENLVCTRIGVDSTSNSTRTHYWPEFFSPTTSRRLKPEHTVEFDSGIRTFAPPYMRENFSVYHLHSLYSAHPDIGGSNQERDNVVDWKTKGLQST